MGCSVWCGIVTIEKFVRNSPSSHRTAQNADIAAECAKRQLRLIFNTHLRDTVPEGVEGARLVNHTAPDSRGVVPAPYWSSTFVDHMVRDSYREPMIAFHTQFAACLKHSPGVPRFWKHAFESAYVFPQKMTNAEIAKTAPAANEKFQRWAQDNNPDIRQLVAAGLVPGRLARLAVPLAHDFTPARAQADVDEALGLDGVEVPSQHVHVEQQRGREVVARLHVDDAALQRSGWRRRRGWRRRGWRRRGWRSCGWQGLQQQQQQRQRQQRRQQLKPASHFAAPGGYRTWCDPIG